jgi:uncharacterized protein YjaG (DUF416 family)
MNYQEFTSILKTQIFSQPYLAQLRFAILICKKLFFDYQKFTEIYNWGNADLLMDAIKLCENAIDNSVDVNYVKDLMPRIDVITPHMDDFGSEISSYALNASASVYETLAFIIDKDKTHIYNIATYFTDTIDFKIQEERDLTEDEIAGHPLMIEAWNFVIEQTKKVVSTN